MLDKKNAQLHTLTQEQLVEKVDEYRRDLFGLRLKSSNEPVKDFSQFKKLRRNIARSLTMANQKFGMVVR